MNTEKLKEGLDGFLSRITALVEGLKTDVALSYKFLGELKSDVVNLQATKEKLAGEIAALDVSLADNKSELERITAEGNEEVKAQKENLVRITDAENKRLTEENEALKKGQDELQKSISEFNHRVSVFDEVRSRFEQDKKDNSDEITALENLRKELDERKQQIDYDAVQVEKGRKAVDVILKESVHAKEYADKKDKELVIIINDISAREKALLVSNENTAEEKEKNRQAMIKIIQAGKDIEVREETTKNKEAEIEIKTKNQNDREINLNNYKEELEKAAARIKK